MPILFHARPKAAFLLLATACGGGAFSSSGQPGGASGDLSSAMSTSAGGASGEGGGTSSGDAGAAGVGTIGGASGTGGDGSSGSAGSGAGGSALVDASFDAPARDGSAEGSANCVPACAPGQYCNSSNRTCTACSDLTRLQFGPPMKLAAPSAGPARNQNFPREAAGANFTGLVYSFDSQSPTGVDIAFAQGSSSSWPMGTALPAPIASAGVDEAPLPIQASVDFAFLYDAEMNGVRGIYSAGMSAGWSRAPFGDPTAALNSGGNNFHVAARVVTGAGMPDAIGRLFWITDRTSMGSATGVRLVTADRLDKLAIDVPIVQANNCHTGGDLEPWITPNGTILFFSSLIYLSAPTCTDVGDGKRRLSYTQVDPATGQQVGRAAAIGWHTTGFDDHAPSLTADSCSLLFASNRDGADLDIYIAPRN